MTITKESLENFNRKDIFVIVCLVAAICFVSLFTPLFNISEIIVEGNAVVTSDTLRQASGIKVGDGFFEININKAKDGISKIAYVDSVDIKRVFPNKIRILITENEECAYINFVGNYVGIDSRGKILEIKQELSEIQKPIVNGIRIENFTIGSYIDVDNKEKEQLLFDMLGYIHEIGVNESIYSMDLSDADNMFFVLKNNIAVKLGGVYNMKYKISFMKSALQELKDVNGGTLDISDTENVVYKG